MPKEKADRECSPDITEDWIDKYASKVAWKETRPIIFAYIIALVICIVISVLSAR